MRKPKLQSLPPLLAILAIALPAAAWGQQVVVRLDPVASKVSFVLDSVMHTVHGSAKFSRGEVAWDAATGLASGELVIDARSFESGNGSRDAKMHKVVLESARYPDIVLALQRLEGTFPASGRADLVAVGEVRIHGALRAVRWPVEVTLQDGKVSAHAQIAVPFIEWGLEDPSVLFIRVGREVQLTIDAVGVLSPGQ
jgi:polyisoprenoid-binding protein YceI